MSKGRLWTKEETAILREMMAAKCDLSEMIDKLGRSKYSIKERWRYINWTEDEKAQRRAQITVNRRILRQFGGGCQPQSRTTTVKREIPQEVIADRNARIDAGPRDLSGAFCGDPPRGFSALDRKLNGDSEPTYIDHRLAQLQRKPSLAWSPAE